jgi:hypothetical protein
MAGGAGLTTAMFPLESMAVNGYLVYLCSQFHQVASQPPTPRRPARGQSVRRCGAAGVGKRGVVARAAGGGANRSLSQPCGLSLPATGQQQRAQGLPVLAVVPSPRHHAVVIEWPCLGNCMHGDSISLQLLRTTLGGWLRVAYVLRCRC